MTLHPASGEDSVTPRHPPLASEQPCRTTTFPARTWVIAGTELARPRACTLSTRIATQITPRPRSLPLHFTAD